MKIYMKAKCLVKKCSKQGSYGRGLCSACYQQAQRLVKGKKTTWAKLEKIGLVKQKARRNNYFIEQFNEM